MQQPSFWKYKSPVSLLLLPFSGIYLLITKLRNKITKAFKPKKPVICIGNVTSGGAGKTPTAIAISKMFVKMGKKPVFLTRGYGGSLRVTTIVNPELHKAKDTGDEPLLLSREATTIVSKKRVLGAKLACEKDFDVIIMDDGMQNPTIKKTLNILVVDGSFGIGSGYIIPAGPLRETLNSALNRTDAIIFIGDDKTGLLHSLPKDKVIKAKIIADTHPKKADKYVAFCGLGNPDKFYTTLEEARYHIIEKQSFSDHHQYSQEDIDNLNNLAKSWNAQLITTEKDFVRLSAEQQNGVETLPIVIEFAQEEQLSKLLEQVVSS